MTCKNCGQSFEGRFCNHCGQKSTVKRIDFRYILTEIPKNIIQLERGFFFTIKELLIHPGKSISAFLAGKRVAYYKPIAFLLITSTLYVLTAYFMERNTFIEDLLSGFKLRMDEQKQDTDLLILSWINQYQTYLPLFILPIFSLASYLAFFKSGYNYFEHLVLSMYITGQQMLIYLILGFIFYGDNPWIITPFVLGVFYRIWTYIQFFNQKKVGFTLGLILLKYLLFILFISFLIFIIGNTYNLIY